VVILKGSIMKANSIRVSDMKYLIILALNNAFDVLNKRTPFSKIKTESMDILDVSPLNIVSFMKDNNIPDDAYFGGRDNGYDAFDAILLCWDVRILTTDKDRLKFKRGQFTSIAFKFVSDLLKNNGYKRNSYNSASLKQFDDTTVYDMYINKNFDRLVEYYSLPFTLND
jgi:hypothetical protein